MVVEGHKSSVVHVSCNRALMFGKVHVNVIQSDVDTMYNIYRIFVVLILSRPKFKFGLFKL